MGNIKFLNGEEQTAELQEKAEVRLDEPPAADRKEEQAAHVLFEDISKREVDAKHFRMSDGSFRAVYYGSPVHYYDENEGKYVGIDNTLTESGCDETDEDDFRGYVNRRGSFRVKLAENTDGRNLMAIEKDGYRLIWKLLGKKDRATGETALASASARVSKANEAGSGTGAELDRLNGEVRYDDFVPGCDLQYVVTPTGVKENIIVREKKEAYIFDFLLKTKNLNLELSEDGRKLLAFVERVDETTGAAQKEVIFDIPAPYMIDGAGNEGYDVTYELSRQRNGKYLFSIVADETWINAEGRVFPVTIDPAIETGKNKNLEIMAYQTGTLTADMRYHYSCGHGFGSHHSGCAYLLFRFSIDHEDRLIQSVKLNLHCGSVAYNGDYKGYEVRPIVSKEDWMFFVTSDFDNNPPVAGEEVIYCFDKKLKAKEWLELDLTKNYGKYPNGYIMSTIDPREDYSAIVSFSKLSSSFETRPNLVVTYTEARSRQSDQFQTNDVKRAGIHTVDLLTGNNRFVHEDRNFDEGKRLSLQVSHVYNGFDAGREYIRTSRGNCTENLGFGRGWKLNLSQFLFKIDNEAENFDDSLKYLYIDQFGNEIIFVKNTEKRAVYSGDTVTEIAEVTEYCDEQGKQLKCGQDGEFLYIEDNNGTKLLFRDNELFRITDRNGDFIELEKDSCYGHISKAWDNLGHSAEFLYNYLGRLYQVNFSDGQSIGYRYDSTGNMIQIIYGDETISEFYYGEYGAASSALTSVRDASGYRLNMCYLNRKVTAIRDYASIREISEAGAVTYRQGDQDCFPYSSQKGIIYEKQGKTLILRYENNLTSVIAENGYAINYQFDSAGFCSCIYETKDSFQSDAEKKKVTKVLSYKGFDLFDTFEMKETAFRYSYLQDGSFEGLSDCQTWIPVTGDSPEYYYGTAAEGNYSLRIEGNYSGKRMFKQVISRAQLKPLRPEGYVLSGYAKADSLPTNEKTKFRIYADFVYSGDLPKDTISVDFDYRNGGWQFGAKGFILEKFAALKYVEIYVEYSYNLGNAYFDCIQFTSGDTVYTKGLPRIYTRKDDNTFDIAELRKIKYKDTDHIFGINSNETVNVDKAKVSYLNIVSMQQNSGTIIIGDEVLDTGADDKMTKLVFERGGKEYEYSLFDVEYAASGITEIINRSGKVRLFKRRDGQVERVELEDNDGNIFVNSSEYDSKGRLKSETDFRGVKKVYEYTGNLYENIQSVQTCGGAEASNTAEQYFTYKNDHYLYRTYDERRVDSSGAQLYSQKNYSESRDKVTSVRLPNGHTILYQYDDTDAYLLGVNTYIYAKDSNGTTHTQNIGIHYSYQFGYLTKIDSYDRISYEYTYDGFGQLIRTTVNGIEVLSAEKYDKSAYDSEDEATFDFDQITLANGTRIKEIFNVKGNLISRKCSKKISGETYEPEWETYRIVYDQYDNIHYTIDKMRAYEDGVPEDENKWLYTYYHYKESGEFDYVTYNGYRSGQEKTTIDDNARVTFQTYGFNNDYIDQSFSYRYDTNASGDIYPDNRVREIVFYDKAFQVGSNETLQYQYDSLGRMTGWNLKQKSADTPILMSEIYTYQRSLRSDGCGGFIADKATNYLSFIEYHCGSKTGREIVTHDKNGNIAKIENGTQSVTFTYDGLSRLISEKNDFIQEEISYFYDADGNLKEVYRRPYADSEWVYREEYIYSAANVNQLQKVTQYNLKTNVSKELFTVNVYDNLGNPCNYSGNVLKWERGRILREFGQNKYAYNSDGIRQEKTTAEGVFHKYYTSGGKILGEEIKSGDKTNYYRYLYVGEQVTGFVINNRDHYFYQYNAAGDVARICDETGEIVAQYRYDAWGNSRIYDGNGVEVTAQDHIGYINPFRYKGYYCDAETGFYYLQSRYYDPKIRRFINADNVEIVAADYLTTLGGQNLYSYSLNNPVNNCDPTGHSVTAVLGLIWSVTKLLVSLGMLALSVYGFVKSLQAFIKEPGWINLILILISAVGICISVYSVYQTFRNVCMWVRRVANGYIKTVDGVELYKARRKDFTDEAWQEIQSLRHNANGETVSNLASGKKIHKGFKLKANGKISGISIKGGGRMAGHYGYTDAFDSITNTIYELKPNNGRSIKAGVKQLKRYLKAYELEKETTIQLVLIVY